jgi:hypothetical protein
VEPPRRQSECDCEEREFVCGNDDDDDLGWKLPLLCVVVCILCLYGLLVPWLDIFHFNLPCSRGHGSELQRLKTYSDNCAPFQEGCDYLQPRWKK